MKNLEFCYDRNTCKILVTDEESLGHMTISFEELERLKYKIENTIAKYKEDSIKHFNDGDYVVDEKNKVMFIYKGHDYNHHQYDCPSTTVQITCHIMILEHNYIFENYKQISDPDTIYRKAEPEEVAYMDYLIKKKREKYFDKKEKKIKNI